MTDTFTVAVIPAKAGIQTIGNTPTQWDNAQNKALSATRRLYDKLDSGLRRNDGAAGFASYCICIEHCLQLCKSQ